MRHTPLTRVQFPLDRVKTRNFSRVNGPRLLIANRCFKPSLISVHQEVSRLDKIYINKDLILSTNGSNSGWYTDPTRLKSSTLRNMELSFHKQQIPIVQRSCPQSRTSRLTSGLFSMNLPKYTDIRYIEEVHSVPYIMGAPFFLAPIIALLKSSFIIKTTAAVYAFVKSSVVVKYLASIATYLKSGAAISVISSISRSMLSLVAPLRILSRWLMRFWHGEEYMDKLRAERKAAGIVQKPRHFTRTTLFLVYGSLSLLAISLLASIERTPVSGRLRFIPMNAEEEALLVEEFLRPGLKPSDTSSRDWVAILRVIAGEQEGGPPGTFSGIPVLDPKVDWRARWVKDVLVRLEDGVQNLNLNSDDIQQVFELSSSPASAEANGENASQDVTYLLVPPVEKTLTVRPSALKHHGHPEDDYDHVPLVTRFGCLVLDAPECNAFSIGFGPAVLSEENKYEEAPGVIVVYTGLLDEILKERAREEQASPKCEPEPTPDTMSNAIFGIFRQASVASGKAVPGITISKEKSDHLACTLAHELAHILLSHSLETHSSSNIHEVIVSFASDFLRISLYPFTMLLGPLFNDWFGQLIRSKSALGLKVTSSCTSRKAEIEADLLGLRILLGAGIDPRIALDDWAPGGLFDRAEMREKETAALYGQSGDENSTNAEEWLYRNGFTRSHPFNSERHKRILEELESWEKMGKEFVLGHSRASEGDETVAPAGN